VTARKGSKLRRFGFYSNLLGKLNDIADLIKDREERLESEEERRHLKQAIGAIYAASTKIMKARHFAKETSKAD